MKNFELEVYYYENLFRRWLSQEVQSWNYYEWKRYNTQAGKVQQLAWPPKTVPLRIRGYPIKSVVFNERDTQMKRKFHTPEQIVKKLREADAAIASGSTIEQVCRQLEVSDATYYNWRKQYGQMKLDQVKQLKSLQKENARLKKLVADLSLDKAILKEALSGNYWARQGSEKQQNI